MAKTKSPLRLYNVEHQDNEIVHSLDKDVQSVA
jgi:hypothetical protein